MFPTVDDLFEQFLFRLCFFYFKRNIICAEGFSAFMLSILIKPRGHLPIFFSFVEQAGTTIDWMQKEDRTERSDPNVDPNGKPNNLIDYALLQE